MLSHNDDEIIITESPRVLEINGPGCLIRPPDLSCIRYMAHRLEIRDVTLGSLNWIPEWILEVYFENCRIMETTAHTSLPQSVIQLTCRKCQIDNPSLVYRQLMHHRLIRLELIGQGLTELPIGLSDHAPNLLFLNLTNNSLSHISKWPKKVRGLRLVDNKLTDLAVLGSLPPYLEDLDLSNNWFSEIPTSELPPYLRKLNMAKNNLQWLPEDHTDYPPNLRELNIADNCGLNDLTDAAFPDMLTTLNASGCEIEKLPHDWEYTCLMNLDLSDNNITNLDELPTGHVLNISYVGNPCWVDSSIASRLGSQSAEDGFSPSDEDGFSPSTEDGFSPSAEDGFSPSDEDGFSPSAEDGFSPSVEDGFIDDNIINDYAGSAPNSVFTSGQGSPNLDSDITNDTEPNNSGSPASFKSLYSSSDDDYMKDYKTAIGKSSSQQSLLNMQQQNESLAQECNAYPANDPLVIAIDYVVASGLRKVESFLSIMSDMLSPTEYQNENENSTIKNNKIAGHILDDIDNYGILGSFD